VSEHVLPVYLNWFINQSTTQAYLASHARGTSVSMISKRAVEEMEIAVPPLERQNKIVELAELAATEQQLLRKLAEKRSYYMERLLMRFALD
jgi:restriction endonuclease S subunit